MPARHLYFRHISPVIELNFVRETEGILFAVNDSCEHNLSWDSALPIMELGSFMNMVGLVSIIAVDSMGIESDLHQRTP
jgi:hypothetical protein